MAFETLKTLINDKIKSGLPTGIRPEEEHNPVLQSIVSTFGQDYAYMGLATTSTSPSTDDNTRMYITNGGGTYTNFLDDTSTPIVVEEGSVCILKGVDGVYSKDVLIDADSIVDATSVRINDNGSGLDLQAYYNSAWVTLVNFSYDGSYATYTDLTTYEIEAVDGFIGNLTADSFEADSITVNGSEPVSLQGLSAGMSIVKSRGNEINDGNSIINTAASSIAELADDGILGDTVLMTAPFVSRANYMDSLIPANDYGRFDVDRSSSKYAVSRDGLLNYVMSDTPSYEYDNGLDPYLLTEPASTNLVTYPISFGNDYWTKSGSSIEADPSTAGSDLLSGFDFTSGWVTSGNGVTINDSSSFTTTSGGTGIRKELLGLEELKTYKLTISGSSNASGLNIKNWANSTTYGIVSASGNFSETIYFQSIDEGLRVLTTGTGLSTITTFTVQEVQGFEAPKVDGSGNLEKEAFKLVEDTSSGTHRISVSLSSSATEHTYAIFAKKGERDRIQLSWRTSGRVAAIFDLSNGSIISESGTLLTSASITTLVNGWYRCSVTFTLDDTGSRPLLLNILDENNNTSYQGDGTSGIYIAYAQLEEQSSATSLMLPTTEGSTTSRVADSCTGSGTAQDFKDYNASGVLYAEIAANGDDDVNKYITINDGTAANRIEIRITDAEDLRARVIVNSVASGLLSYAPSDITGFHKVAIRYAQSEFSLWVNGSERDTTTSGDVFPSGALTEVSFDRGDDIAHFYGKTKALEVLPYMSDEEMVTLTT